MARKKQEVKPATVTMEEMAFVALKKQEDAFVQSRGIAITTLACSDPQFEKKPQPLFRPVLR